MVVTPPVEVVSGVVMAEDVLTSAGVIVTVVAVGVVADTVVEEISDKTVMMPFIDDG